MFSEQYVTTVCQNRFGGGSWNIVVF